MKKYTLIVVRTIARVLRFNKKIHAFSNISFQEQGVIMSKKAISQLSRVKLKI